MTITMMKVVQGKYCSRSGRLLPVKGSLIAVILTWRRNSHLRPRQRHRLAFMTPFCYWLLLFSGDIESNPGPAKFPCRHPIREIRLASNVICVTTGCTNDVWTCPIMNTCNCYCLTNLGAVPPASKKRCRSTTVLPSAAVTVSPVWRLWPGCFPQPL